MRKFFLFFGFCCGWFALFGQEAKLMLPIGHSGKVTSIVFSPDGKKIATSSLDHCIKIWDAHSGTLLMDLIGHANAVNSIAFSPDGTKIVSASLDKTAKIWDVQTGICLFTLSGHKYEVLNAKFSPEGKKILTFSYEVCKIWDVTTGILLFDLSVAHSEISCAVFSPDGQKIATGYAEHSAKVWQVLTGKMLIDIKGHNGQVSSVNFSPDCKMLVTTSMDSTAKIWDAQSGVLLHILKGNNSWVTDAAISPNGKIVVTGSWDNTGKIWDLQSGELLFNLKGLSRGINNIKFSPDGNVIAAISHSIPFSGYSEDYTVKMWSSQSGKLINSLIGISSNVCSMTFSPDSKKLATGCFDNTAKIWEVSTGMLLNDLKGQKGSLESGTFSPDVSGFATITNNKTIKMWGLGSAHPEKEFIGNKYFFSPDGKKIMTIENDTIATIYNAITGSRVSSFIAFSYNSNIIFSPDSKMVAEAGWVNDKDVHLKIINAETGNLNKLLIGHKGEIRSISFSPDSKKILTTSLDRTVKIWDVETGLLRVEINLNVLNDNNNYFLLGKGSFSSDGTRVLIIATAADPEIRDAQTGALIQELKGLGHWNNATFSPDGKYIITNSESSRCKIWDAKTGYFLADTPADSYYTFLPDGNKVVVAIKKDLKIFDIKNRVISVDLNLTESDIKEIKVSSDGKKIIASLVDKTIKILDVQTGKLLYRLLAFDSTDYLVTDPYGHYDGTEAARKLLYFTCGTEVIGLDQVKDQLWVPNLAERIMKGDSINAPKLSDLNICGLTPSVEKADRTGYHFNITPRRGGLGETVLLVNDIEIKRYQPNQLAKTATGYELNVTEQELQTYFIAGKLNPVSVKAYTAKNDIASRGVQVMQDETKKQVAAPNLYAVMIGVSDYKGTELQLKYAAKDATDISAAVAASAGKLLGKGHVFNYNLTTSANHYQLPEKIAIKNVFGEIGKKATANDILLVFFAGHGVTSGEKKQFYFLTADASQSSATEAPDQVGISTKELSEWMQPTNIKAQKRILILDACNSGQAINEIVKIGNADQNYLAARNDDKAEQIKAIDKLNEKSGLFILAASASNQSAYEMGRYSQGLLTYSLLKAIKQQPDILEDGKYLNVSRWFNAAEKTVSDMVRETGNRQEPQIVSAGNFNIGLVDPEVMDGIKLAEEKPLFTASKFLNVASYDDNLDFSSLIDQSMNEISSRGGDSEISYVSASASTDAWSLSGGYDVKGDELTVKVNITQNKEMKNKMELTGKKSELKELAKKVVNEATGWILKKK